MEEEMRRRILCGVWMIAVVGVVAGGEERRGDMRRRVGQAGLEQGPGDSC